MLLELLMAGLLSAQGPTGSAPSVTLGPGDRVIVTDERQSIRGRITEITPESLTLDTTGARVQLPFAGVRQIDRIGDSIANGSAIGAAVGAGVALAAMARACANTNCSDTSANLDPRITLLGTLAGAGIGALVDAAIEKRKPAYRMGSQVPAPLQPMPAPRSPATVFVRAGWARLSDDEGSLGTGATVGAGLIVPIARRFGMQIAYDRQHHRRDFDNAAPPGVASSDSGFTGTEQLVTAKALLLFRRDKAVQPYVGFGAGLFDSERVSEFPTYFIQPGGLIAAGPPEVYRYHTSEFSLGLSSGFDARVTKKFSILGDLTLDMSNPSVFSSARFTAGAGWHF